MEEQKKEQVTSDWIKKVQARSWEIELFVSGGSLFSLMQISEVVLEFVDKLTRINFILSSSLALYSIVIPILVGGFALHLGVRGFWVAMVILYRVHPDGINLERIQLTEPFMRPIRTFNLRASIERLDKVCSLVFSATFVYALLLFGLSTLAGFTMWFIFFPSQNPDFFSNIWFWFPYALFVIPFMVGYMLFLYIDLPTFGFLRRRKWLSKIWFPFYQVYNFLTLGFLWRPYLQVITSNIKNRFLVFVWIVLFYIVGLAFVLSTKSNNHQVIESLDDTSNIAMPGREGHYQDKNETEQWTSVTIQSDVITENYLKVFVPSHHLQSSFENSKEKSQATVNLMLNDSLCQSLPWMGLTRNNGQTGLQTVLDINHMKAGLHSLLVMAPADTTKVWFWKP
jgi:hypothetical protein